MVVFKHDNAVVWPGIGITFDSDDHDGAI